MLGIRLTLSSLVDGHGDGPSSSISLNVMVHGGTAEIDV